MSAEQITQDSGYGYQEDNVGAKPRMSFGLNAGNCFLTKFEWTENGGKDGAKLEALEILFNINGQEKRYKKFPISKAFAKDENGNKIEVTDPSHPAMQQAKRDLSSVLSHILGCFATQKEIRDALTSQPIQSFKHYCHILSTLLPEGFEQTPLDMFGQYQWSISGESKVTYVEIPKNMKHGRWLSAEVKPVGGEWIKQQKTNADSSEVALRYVDVEGSVHPFQRNGWYMSSNFSFQQKEEAQSSQAGASMNEGSRSSDDNW